MNPTPYLTEPYEPVDIDDVVVAFPTEVRHLMPDPATIDESQLTWGPQLQRDWFFYGLTSLDAEWTVDRDKAMRHLKCIQGSFEPKHEHKEAAVAFLLEQWIDGRPTWQRRERAS